MKRKPDQNSRFGERLRGLRSERDLSMEELCEQFNRSQSAIRLNRSTIYRYEKGQQEPMLSTVGIPGSGLSYTTNSSANKSGEPQQATPVYSSKNKTTALILAIIFGWAGVHRFYAGKAGTGILWLLTCGMFCFGWVVDIVKIARGRFTDGHGHIIDRPTA